MDLPHSRMVADVEHGPKIEHPMSAPGIVVGDLLRPLVSEGVFYKREKQDVKT